MDLVKKVKCCNISLFSKRIYMFKNVLNQIKKFSSLSLKRTLYLSLNCQASKLEPLYIEDGTNPGQHVHMGT